MLMQQSQFIPDLDFNRLVPCYCGKTKVVSRRDPSKDRYVVCSRECWDRMVSEGNQETGSLLREVLR
jgi:hypothetical protein